MDVNTDNSAYEEVLDRVGVRLCSGSMAAAPSPDPDTNSTAASAAWSNNRMGVFILDHPCSTTVEFDTVATRDSIVCGVHLNNEVTQMDVGGQSFCGNATDMNMIFLPRMERLKFATSVAGGLRSVTIVIDIEATMNYYGGELCGLSAKLRQAVEAREPMMERMAPGMFGKLASEMAARRSNPPILPSLYYEGKTCELASALFTQIAERGTRSSRAKLLDKRTLIGVERVRAAIEAKPECALDVDGLALDAAMNRTKLRAAFKAAYGMTLAEYRIEVLLRMADESLRNTDSRVQEVAYRAGYANASSFIVAYKRHFGFSPGGARPREHAR